MSNTVRKITTKCPSESAYKGQSCHTVLWHRENERLGVTLAISTTTIKADLSPCTAQCLLSTSSLAAVNRPQCPTYGPSVPASDIKVVLFDLGGVLLPGVFTPFDVSDDANGLPRGTIRRLVLQTGSESAFVKMDAGQLPITEFEELFSQQLTAAAGREINVRGIFIKQWREALTVCHDGMVALAKDLKEGGWTTAMCTNNYFMDTEKTVSFAGPAPLDTPEARADYFHHVFESCRLGVWKPDRAYFEHVVTSLCVQPAQCLLLDDDGRYVLGARQAGIHAWQVVDIDQTVADVRKFFGI